MGGRELAQPPPFDVLYGGGGYPPNPYPPNPYPPPPPPQLPGCQLSDPRVNMTPSGLWAGPNCTPTDGLGHIPGGNSNNNGYNNSSNVSQAPPGPYQPGPSSVSWQSAQSPFTPGEGAIKGGTGKGSKPNQPLYVCRAYFNGALLPGKWMGGQCSVRCLMRCTTCFRRERVQDRTCRGHVGRVRLHLCRSLLIPEVRRGVHRATLQVALGVMVWRWCLRAERPPWQGRYR